MRIAPVLAILVLAAAAGCSSTASKPSSSPAPAAADASPLAATSTAPAAAAVLTLGAAATLTTPSGPLEVTVVKMVDPAKPKEPYVSPAKNQHWIAIELRFVNKGTKPLINSPMIGLEATDGQGQPQTSFPDQEVAAGPMIDPVYGLHLQPGDTTLGYIVWSVPDGTKLAHIRYTPPGGSSAQWALG